MTRLAIVTIVGLATTATSACRASENAKPAPALRPIPVAAVPIVAVDTFDRLEAGGTVTARESALVSSRIVATILSVRVQAGDRVRAGDVLVTLDARDPAEHTRQARAGALGAEKALAQAKAEHSAAEAEQRLAATWQTRIMTLHARNSATEQERDEAEARLAATVARVAGARAAIEVAEANVAATQAALGLAMTTESFASLNAPFDGVVTERLTDPGNLAAPGVSLLRIESENAKQVTVRVDEARAAYVHSGDRVEVAIDAAGDRGTSLEAAVTEVARAVGTDERAFTVKVTLPPSVSVRTGSFARVFFRGAPRRTLIVPAAAIQRHGQVTSVFVVQDGTARLRLVHAGLATSAGVDVLAGVDPGELVVSPLPPGLVDGAPVVVSGGSPGTGAMP